MTRHLTAAAAAIVAMGMTHSVLAQEATTFDIDATDEQGAAFEDFNASASEWGMHGMWDADADGMLSADEMHRGMFDMYDADGDGYLSDEEIEAMRGERMFYSEGDDQAQDEAQTNN